MERRCLRSAIDATSEVEIRDRIRDFVIGGVHTTGCKHVAASSDSRVRRVMLLLCEARWTPKMPDLT